MSNPHAEEDSWASLARFGEGPSVRHAAGLSFDLRGLNSSDLADLGDQMDQIARFRDRLGVSIVLRAAEGESALSLTEAIGHLSADRVSDLYWAGTRLLQLLALDGLVAGERPLKALSDEALLERLREVLRVVAEKGAVGLHVHGLHEVFDGSSGVAPHARGIDPHGGLQQAGHEHGPQPHHLGEFLPIEGDGVQLPLNHSEPPVPVRATPPP